MNAPAAFFPWHIDLAAQWLAQRDRFAHAWLVHGLNGIGKRQFVQAGAASLLCESPISGLACGKCRACNWVALGNHPDLRLIRPEALAQLEGNHAANESPGPASAASRTPSRDIRVEQLRVLHNWFNTATHRGGWRVAVLYPAEALNSISANALLKVLEEPPKHTVFLLTADAPDRLLPTLVSRCRRLPLPVPPAQLCLPWLIEQGVEQPEQWLALAGGAPLRALEWAQGAEQGDNSWLVRLMQILAPGNAGDIGPVADLLDKVAPSVWIDTLQRFVFDLLLSTTGQPVRYFPAHHSQIEAIAAHTSVKHIAEAAKWLTSQRAVANHPLSTKLFVHSVLQRVAHACNPAELAASSHV